MEFSYQELSRLVDLSSWNPTALRNRLTFAGFEVEGMRKAASASRLIIGKILTCEPHPDSDHLHCLTVDCGQEGIRDIVCGAPNARAGLVVIVALPGCELPAIGETIQLGEIRGKKSDGMCCSLSELGVSKEVQSEAQLSGIEELPLDAPIGETNVLSYLGLDDIILDINVLPNRTDCLSYLGMAREIAALTGAHLRPIPSFAQLSFAKEQLVVKTLTPKAPRFSALSLHHLIPRTETPLDIVRTLQASGIRSLNPLVDLGNYVMLLTGEPLNLYDLNLLGSSSLEVRDDYEGKFIAFDGKSYDLIPGDLVIFSEGKAVCLAGIEAGEAAMVSSSTQEAFVEAGIFYHASIRHTSQRLGLSSPSSQLFAKGRNPKMIPEAIAVLISLLPRFFSSYEIGAFSDSQSASSEKPISFAFSLAACNQRLGSSYSEAQLQEVLNAYRIEEKGGRLFPPEDRLDLIEQCDMEEEIFRYFGAEQIQPGFSGFPLTKGELTPAQKNKRVIRELLIARGFDEALTYTLISKAMDSSLRVFSSDPSYVIANPMTKDHEAVRSDLLPSLLEAIDYNVSHQHQNLKLFEVSNLDTPNGSHTYLSLGLRGVEALSEDYGEKPFDFFYLKGVIEAIFSKLGITETRYRLQYSKNPKFHPNCSADIFIGKDLIGTFGQLHPSFRKDKVFVAELDLGYLLHLPSSSTKFKPFDSYPIVRRDLSIRLDGKATFEQIKKTVLRTKDTFVNDVFYFDDFLDPETNNRYLGISLLLGKEGSTLKDNEINDTLDKVRSELKAQLSLSLRGE